MNNNATELRSPGATLSSSTRPTSYVLHVIKIKDKQFFGLPVTMSSTEINYLFILSRNVTITWAAKMY